jgi:predicted PurR-regulated permease PerM
MTDPAPPATATATRLALEAGPILLFLGLLAWNVRAVLSPLVVLPLLVFVLWPLRGHPLGLRLITAAVLLFAIWFTATLSGVLTPFVIAFALAYLLAPAVDALVRRRVPRGLAIAAVLVPFLAGLVLLVLVLVPQLERQLLEFASRIPELARRVFTWGLQLRERFVAGGGGGLLTDEQLQRLQALQPADLVALFQGKWEAIGTTLWRGALGVGRGIGSGLELLLSVVGWVIVAPVVTFYLLRSWPELLAGLESLLPPAHRPGVIAFLREYDRALGRFVRGQLTEAALVGVLTGGALALLDFPGAVLVGVVAGTFNLIPVIGLPISIIPGVLFALVAPEVGPALLKLAAVFAVVQFIDGSITGPRIVGGSVGLNPVWVMLAVLVFGSLMGFVGMLLAVPLAVLVKMLALRALGRAGAAPITAAAPTAAAPEAS